MYAAALFTVAEIWKQPNYPSTEELIKEIWYKNRILVIKKSEIPPFETKQMDQKIIMLDEISQTMSNAVCYHVYVEFKI